MPKLPLVGQVPKGWLIAVGGGSVLVLGYVYLKHRQASTATAAGSSLDPNAIDPATGMTYAEEEQLAMAGQFGGFGFTGAGTGSAASSGAGGVVQGPGAFTTNADWAQYAEQQLSGVVDATALSAAIGVYLTGRAATSDQESLIDQAIAIANYPPVAGPGGFPPNIKQSSGTGNGHQVTVPNVVGQNKLGASRQISAAGLVPKITPGSHDPIQKQSPAAGSQVNKGSTVTLTGRK